MRDPRILHRRIEYTNAWLDVVAKDVDLGPPRGLETFYATRTGAYVAIVALTPDGDVPLVRQYRPALETFSLELPSGAVEVDESPERAAERELFEETGCRAQDLELLGRVDVDPGRTETSQWCFFASTTVPGRPPERDEQLELVLASPDEVRRLVGAGELRVGLHLAALLLAERRGLLR